MGQLPSFCSLDHVPPTTVVGRHSQGNFCIVLSLRLCGLNQRLQLWIELTRIANDFQAHAIGRHVIDFFLKITGKQAHQNRDFIFRSTPVLGAESKKT